MSYDYSGSLQAADIKRIANSLERLVNIIEELTAQLPDFNIKDAQGINESQSQGNTPMRNTTTSGGTGVGFVGPWS